MYCRVNKLTEIPDYPTSNPLEFFESLQLDFWTGYFDVTEKFDFAFVFNFHKRSD